MVFLIDNLLLSEHSSVDFDESVPWYTWNEIVLSPKAKTTKKRFLENIEKIKRNILLENSYQMDCQHTSDNSHHGISHLFQPVFDDHKICAF